MSLPSTLVLRDDEEPTVVDAHHQSQRTAKEASRRGCPFRVLRPINAVRFRWFGHLCLLLAGALLVATSSVAFRERSESARLHQTIEQLRREKDAWLTAPRTGNQEGSHDPNKARSDSTEVHANEGARDRDQLEQRGAALLVANDYRAALEHYQVMSARFPGEPAFPRLVQILRARLRCESGHPSRGFSCR